MNQTLPTLQSRPSNCKLDDLDLTKVRTERPDALYVVRESVRYDMLLFDAMREQTYTPYRHYPEVEAVRAAGLAPMGDEGSFWITWTGSDGTEYKTEIPVEVRLHGHAKAYLFHVGSAWHLWSQGSAYKKDTAGLNDFTVILIEVIEQLRPRQLIAANISRLIRSQDQGNRLAVALTGRVDVVRAGGVNFELVGPGAEIGMMTFGMFATLAAMERNWIVTRLLAGKFADWRRGAWIYGRATVPFGYRIDPSTRALVPDPDRMRQVRDMLLILSSTTTAPRQMLRQLSKLGVVTMRAHRRLGKRLPVGSVGAAREYIDSLYSWAPLWIHGEHVYRVTTPLEYVPELVGVPLTTAPWDEPGQGEFQLVATPGVPDGGWAEQDVLDMFEVAARLRSNERAERLGVANRPLCEQAREASICPGLHDVLLAPKPMRARDERSAARRVRRRGNTVLPLFSGLSWQDEESVYELQIAHTNTYRLIRWPLRAARRLSDSVVGS